MFISGSPTLQWQSKLLTFPINILFHSANTFTQQLGTNMCLLTKFSCLAYPVRFDHDRNIDRIVEEESNVVV